MTNELISALSGAIIGAAIGGFFGWLLPLISERRIQAKQKELFSMALIDDLSSAPDLFEKVTNDWEKARQVSFEYTIELKERRKIYQRHFDYLLFYPSEIRSKIFNYYIKTDKLITLLETLQNNLWRCFGEYKNVLKLIKRTNPHISDEEAGRLAMVHLDEENKEAITINILIEKQIKQLADFGREAKEIIEKLKN